ncbi:MAG: hypothetical protein HC904_03345 [Blastochloris sp.]|nr:hypothetical protein [Blastochloris sp.]
MNAFAEFGLKPQLQVNLDEIKQRYLKLSAERHPDQGGEEDALGRLNRARQILISDRQRLKHFLELNEGEASSAITTVPESLVDCFMKAATLFRRCDVLKKERRGAESVLEKAALQDQALALWEEMQGLVGELERCCRVLRDALPEMDKVWIGSEEQRQQVRIGIWLFLF